MPLEEASAYVGLYYNDIKTMFVTTETDPKIVSFADKIIKHVTDKYLGSYIMNSEKDFKIRKALAWIACNKLEKIWRSNIQNNLKLNLFRSTVEPILLYGSETWTSSSSIGWLPHKPSTKSSKSFVEIPSNSGDYLWQTTQGKLQIEATPHTLATVSVRRTKWCLNLLYSGKTQTVGERWWWRVLFLHSLVTMIYSHYLVFAWMAGGPGLQKNK